MAAEVVLSAEALEDISQAYDWYEKRQDGLGEEFLSCVDACIQRIRRSPELHARVFEGFRRAIVRRFPYSIFYEYIRDTVIVYCVFHSSQDPNKWRDRLK